MDIVHHTLIGGAGFALADAAEAPLLGAAFVAGSVFPDLDVAFMALGKRFYLRHHQGISHSLLLAPLFAVLLAWGVCVLVDMPWQWPVAGAALAGLLLHVGLDAFNTYRIALLAPLTNRRVSLDAVFFIDTVSLSLTGLFFVSYSWLDFSAAGWLYPLLFAAYFTGKLMLQRNVKRRLKAREVIPGGFNPFVFYVLEQAGDDLYGYTFNALTGRRYDVRHYEQVDEKYSTLASDSRLFRDMQQVARCLAITGVEDTGQGTVITAQDVAVRNFGGRFAKTVLRFDREGHLVDEMAYI